MGQETPEEIKRRLSSLQSRRDEAARTVERSKGRLEEAERAMADLEAECRSKGLDPDNLDASIEKIRLALNTSLQKYEGEIQRVEEALNSIQKNVDSK